MLFRSGVDLSHKQIENARRYLSENGYTANFICSPMEADMDIPKNYFDYIYSIYGIGWTTDLDGTFQKISSYLKKDGIFIFSWHHPLNYCIAWSCDERKDVIENNTLVMNKSYFDESYFRMPVNGSEILLCNRKISTYVNALAKAGFVIEKMVEQTDKVTMQMKEYEQVLKSLERMDKKWHRNEEYWILRIRYYVELKQGKELKETLEQIQQEHIYLSAKGKEALAFWQE